MISSVCEAPKPEVRGETQPPHLDELAEEIRACHDRILRGVRAAINEARRAGDALIKAKELAGHGNWTTWLEKNFPASRQTANVYMAIAREWHDNLAAAVADGLVQTIEQALGHIGKRAGKDAEGKAAVGGTDPVKPMRDEIRKRLTNYIKHLPAEAVKQVWEDITGTGTVTLQIASELAFCHQEDEK
jgi:hypothetical protein